jgi:hypothetical protein
MVLSIMLHVVLLYGGEACCLVERRDGNIGGRTRRRVQALKGRKDRGDEAEEKSRNLRPRNVRTEFNSERRTSQVDLMRNEERPGEERVVVLVHATS